MPQPGYVIDSVGFARGGGVAVDAIELSRFARLSGQLESAEGSADFEVRGSEEDGKPFLSLTVRAQLTLRCQRCLGELRFPLFVHSRLMLVEAGVDWPEDEIAEERFDAIPAHGELDLLELVEDEILLALPIAPRHASCELPAAGRGLGQASPFAGLAQWLKH